MCNFSSLGEKKEKENNKTKKKKLDHNIWSYIALPGLITLE